MTTATTVLQFPHLCLQMLYEKHRGRGRFTLGRAARGVGGCAGMFWTCFSYGVQDDGCPHHPFRFLVIVGRKRRVPIPRFTIGIYEVSRVWFGVAVMPSRCRYRG